MGSTGQTLARNSMAIGNVAYYNYLTWANPLLGTLEEQMLVPMFGDLAHVELGHVGERRSTRSSGGFKNDASCTTAMFADAAFPGAERIRTQHRQHRRGDRVVRAHAALRAASPYDRVPGRRRDGDERLGACAA